MGTTNIEWLANYFRSSVIPFSIRNISSKVDNVKMHMFGRVILTDKTRDDVEGVKARVEKTIRDLAMRTPTGGTRSGNEQLVENLVQMVFSLRRALPEFRYTTFEIRENGKIVDQRPKVRQRHTQQLL
ncbi:MAG: hypothetical protein FWD89_00665 [Firmicutes bacterium]|nr:hypothetical protein [Bacillota bacterium]